jgi:glycosyltransferase involved in cell wall biosynthesis
MMSNRKFGVMLPTFNSMRYLDECVQSVLRQTYTNFKLYIVDGGSSDGTLDYLQLLNDNRVSIHPSETRLTIEENWDRFTAINDTEWMTIIGHDDVYKPDFLEAIIELINSAPEASLYHTHFTYINREGALVRNCKKMPRAISPDQFLTGILTAGIDIMATGFVFRSADYRNIGGIPLFPKLLFADDALWLQLVQRGYLAVSEKECFSFRFHQNTSNVLLGETTFYALGFYSDFLEKVKKQNDENKKIIETFSTFYIKARCKEMVIRIIRKPLNERNNVTALQIINGCKKYAQKLSSVKQTGFLSDKILLLAKWIDSNPISRNLFVWFKKYFTKPIIK